MTTYADQISGTTRAHLDEQFNLINDSASKLFSGVEQFLGLQLEAARATLEQSKSNTKEILKAQNPQQAVNTALTASRPSTENLISYSKHVANIAKQTQQSIAQNVEQQVAASRRTVDKLFDYSLDHAPAGSEAGVSLMREFFNQINAGYDQFSTASRNVAEAAQTNLNSVAEQVAAVATRTAQAGQAAQAQATPAPAQAAQAAPAAAAKK